MLKPQYLSESSDLFVARSEFISDLFRRSFIIPEFQRNYSWGEDQINQFMDDFETSLSDNGYFLGLIILTSKEDDFFDVIDGQQRIITIMLIVISLYSKAKTLGRSFTVESLRSKFIYSYDYMIDEPKFKITFPSCEYTRFFNLIVDGNEVNPDEFHGSKSLLNAYNLIQQRLFSDNDKYGESEGNQKDYQIISDWTNFIERKLHIVVFIHPNDNSAYNAFEVINTRGKSLTPVDLLKGYLLSQQEDNSNFYVRWENLRLNFQNDGAYLLYIRHILTLMLGYILPKDIYSRVVSEDKKNNNFIVSFFNLMEEKIELYNLVSNPEEYKSDIDEEVYLILSTLSNFNITSIRPLLLSIYDSNNYICGLSKVLRIVIKRLVTGYLGTGSIEKKFSDAAKITIDKGWEVALSDLNSITPKKEEFKIQVATRRFNKRILLFLKRSIAFNTIYPKSRGIVEDISEKIDKNVKNDYGNVVTSILVDKKTSLMIEDGSEKQILEFYNEKLFNDKVEKETNEAVNIWYQDEQ